MGSKVILKEKDSHFFCHEINCAYQLHKLCVAKILDLCAEKIP
jgi:hypothetical protein